VPFLPNSLVSIEDVTAVLLASVIEVLRLPSGDWSCPEAVPNGKYNWNV
jgi:hypothetical protein